MRINISDVISTRKEKKIVLKILVGNVSAIKRIFIYEKEEEQEEEEEITTHKQQDSLRFTQIENQSSESLII